MSEVQTTGNPIPAAPPGQPGVFGTKIPSSVAFGIGVLLFFMPFLDIKCNSLVLQKVSGVQLATGFKIESPGSDNSLIGSFENMSDKDTKVNSKIEKKDPNMMALAALVLGIVALVCALANIKTGGLIAGILATVALIATMIDVKSKLNAELPELNKGRNNTANGIDRLGDGIYISVDFTPWFYIAVIAFGVGAFFCYKWLKEK
jgi:hypothetical protein